jgi:hypothetical protein
MGNFYPQYAENADALIDYALSHIPPSKLTTAALLVVVPFVRLPPRDILDLMHRLLPLR